MPPTDDRASPRLLTGWGRTAPSSARVVRPLDASAVERLVHDGVGGAGGPLVARGLGRSYGDAAQCAGGTVLDLTGLDHLQLVDADRGLLRGGAGASLDAVMRRYLPDGWFVPVTPGTRQVTLGGAVAADIHGKNHHRDGSFCRYVEGITLATPTGVHRLSPDEDPELFWATAGGMGLTGVVTEITLRLLPVETTWMRVDTDRTDDLDGVMSLMETGDHRYRYSVAWVDCTISGRHLGRAVLTRGDHASLDDLPGRRRRQARTFPSGARLGVPFTPPPGLLNNLSIRAFNEAMYRRAPRRRVGEPQRIPTFFHPLDGVTDWNRLYGPRGFVQYQFVVGFEHGDTVRRAVEMLSSSGVPSFLAVLKRFGPGDEGPLSFPMEGWTLALDLPVGPPDLPGLLNRLDDLVAGAGGRVYLAKDARLRPELVATMYPRLGELDRARKRVDPEGRLTSDLARRLGLDRLGGESAGARLGTKNTPRGGRKEGPRKNPGAREQRGRTEPSKERAAR